MKGVFERRKHWENVYQSKQQHEVGWFQQVPFTSLEFIKDLGIPTTAKIIDVGGGDSYFVDYLLDLGYQNITVLDISTTALDKAKKRLGDRAGMVKWIEGDATDFNPDERYDFWHDRALLHFLTDQNERESYVEIIQQNIENEGFLVIGTFSEWGPKKCSGIEIRQYSEPSLSSLFEGKFRKLYCLWVDHKTPGGSLQNFIFCSFRKDHE